VDEIKYWEIDFPDWGDEENPSTEKAVEGFGEVFDEAVRIRLRAEVPVVSYLSGGVDSTTVASQIKSIRGSSVPTFTIQIADPALDETDRALLAARTIGSQPTIVTLDGPAIANAYPELVRAADCPVVDTSSAALLCLAKEVHRQGYRVAMTGEGADESLAGYPWFKVNRILRLLDVGALKPSLAIRRAVLRFSAPDVPWESARRTIEQAGGPYAYNDLYGLMTTSRRLFYRAETFAAIDGHLAYEDLDLNYDRIHRWHPMNQGLYLGFKTMLPGLLMNHKGDRPAMNSSVETRYPFLDDKVIDYCRRLHPRFKLRGLRRDKHLLRLFAARTLPGAIANRPKAMFRAPFASTFFAQPPAFVSQLLSRDSLNRTGLFDTDAVVRHREEYDRYRWSGGRRLAMEMGLTAVMATQLWHHTFLGGGLCDLPTWSAPMVDLTRPANVRTSSALLSAAAG
jgi:asparagine synthase (glutamine-hydrolysing)